MLREQGWNLHKTNDPNDRGHSFRFWFLRCWALSYNHIPKETSSSFFTIKLEIFVSINTTKQQLWTKVDGKYLINFE
jgi:hypothetical protein